MTHEYQTAEVVGEDLDNTMTLVGVMGGLSSIYEVSPSNIAPGLLSVETEHGLLLLDPDEIYQTLYTG